MSLLERARAKRADRQATHDDYEVMWDERERKDAARRAVALVWIDEYVASRKRVGAVLEAA